MHRGNRGGGRGGYGNRGGRGRGSAGRGSAGRGRGNRGRGPSRQYHEGPPDQIVEIGTVLNKCEGEVVCTALHADVVHFNAPLFTSDMVQLGRVDEILGQMHKYMFSMKLDDSQKLSSINIGDKVFVSPEKLLPLSRFLPKPDVPQKKQSRPKKEKPKRGFNKPRGRKW